MRRERIADIVNVIRTVKDWPTYAIDYLGLTRRNRLLLRLRNGAKLEIRSGTADRRIFNEVWIHRNYTPTGFEIGEKDYVLDIGAHIGIFSVYASRLAKRGMVYAFEPAPENYEMLTKNIRINEATNIVPCATAISDRSGQKELFLSEHNTGWNSFYMPAARDKSTIIVQTLSLEQVTDEQRLPRIDLLKMDCEGAEYDILFSSSERVLRSIRRISMEYHNLDEDHNVGSLLQFLSGKGFEVMTRTGDTGMLYASNRGV